MRTMLLGAGCAVAFLVCGSTLAAPPQPPVMHGVTPVPNVTRPAAQNKMRPPARTPVKPALANKIKYPLDMAKPQGPRGGGAEINEATCADCSPEQKSATDQIRDVLGQGYNSFNNQMTGDCVDGRINGPAPNASKAIFSLRLIRSSDELKRAMSAEASLGADFASFSASASAKITSDQQASSNSDYLLARVQVFESPNITMHGPVAQETPANNSAAAQARFFADCGDSFISHVVMGGEFLTMFRYQASSEADKSTFEAKFNASGWGVSASASLSQSLESVESNLSVAIDYVRVGGTGGPSDNTIDAHIRYAVGFPNMVTPQNAAYVSFVTEPYHTIADAKHVRVAAADYSGIKRSYDALVSAKLSRESFDAFLGQVKEASFPYGIGDIHANLRNKVEADIARSDALLVSCASDPAPCKIPPDLMSFTRPEDVVMPQPGALNVQSGNTASATYSNGTYHFKLSGKICYHDNEMCHNDGVGGEADYGVEIRLNGRTFRYSGPITITPPPGQVTTLYYRIVDSDYGDNTGSLYSVAY